MATIRNTRPADAALLPAIERSAGKTFLTLQDLAWIADDDVQSIDRHLELIAGGYSWVAAQADDGPIGFLSAERLEGALHVWEFAVEHTFQGRGIGRTLLARAVDAAKSRGLSAVTLTTFRDVAWNQQFYEQLGFRALSADAMPAHLQAILDEEAANGLPPDARCAMLLALG